MSSHEVVIIVPGSPIYRGDRTNPEYAGRSTQGVRNTIIDGRTLPVMVGDSDEVVGSACSMDFIKTDGQAALLFHATLNRPGSDFQRRADGAIIAGVGAAWSVSGIYPTELKVFLLEVRR